MSDGKRSMGVLLSYLESEGHLDALRRARVVKRLSAPADGGSHWAIQVLLGAGAWLAALLGLLFVGVLFRFNLDAALLIPLGLLTAGSGAALGLAGQNGFLQQLARALMLTGQLLAVLGGGQMYGHSTGAAISAALCCVAAHLLSTDRGTRFLSTAMMLSFATFWAVDRSTSSIGLLTAAVAIGTTWWFTSERAPRGLKPAAMACAAALPLLLGLHATIAFRVAPQPEIIERVVLMVALLRAIASARRGLAMPSGEVLGITTGAVCTLAVMGTPGLLAAALLLVLAHDRQDRVLLAIGGLTLPYFLFCFYHDLRITLAAKSAALITSGLVLLAGRLYLLARPWATGGAR